MFVMKHFYPPEMVMRFQAEISLTEAQKTQFRKEVKSVQSEVTDLKFDMSEAAADLSKLVAAGTVDEKKAVAQSDKVMALEAKIKRRHLQLLVRIKNLLTAEQKQKLDQVKKTAGPMHMMDTK